MENQHYHFEPQFSSVKEGRQAFKAGILSSKFSSTSGETPIKPSDLLIYLDSLKSGHLSTEHEKVLFNAVEQLKIYKDTFNLSIILRILYAYSDFISPELKEACLEMLISFSYWPDEVVTGKQNRSMATENHFMLYASNGILAAQLLPDNEFRFSKKTGIERIEPFTERLEKWLDMRYQTGFSEFLSNVYYPVDIMGLANVYDFIEEPKIKKKAAMVLDLLFMDMAFNHWRGGFCAASGRIYFDSKKTFFNHRTLTIFYQWLGFGAKTNALNRHRGAAFFAVTGYTPPNVLRNIGLEQPSNGVSQQRQSWRVEDAGKYGIDINSTEQGLHILTMDGQSNPLFIKTFTKMLDSFSWWKNKAYGGLGPVKFILKGIRSIKKLRNFAHLLERDITRVYRPVANTYTYRSPSYMLSTVQDHRKGYGGFQQLAWQASIGPSALVFTSNPAPKKDDKWTGNNVQPRCAQHKNVCICHYRIERFPAFMVRGKDFKTHAWFPKEAFDEIEEQSGWIFGRKNDGYLALRSKRKYQWEIEKFSKGNAIVAKGRKNTWICELGDKEQWGSFETFISKVASAKITLQDDHVEYLSPSIGKVAFGWDGDFEVKGQRIDLHPPYRYDNPWIRVLDLTKGFKLALDGAELVHDWKSLKREVVE